MHQTTRRHRHFNIHRRQNNTSHSTLPWTSQPRKYNSPFEDYRLSGCDGVQYGKTMTFRRKQLLPCSGCKRWTHLSTPAAGNLILIAVRSSCLAHHCYSTAKRVHPHLKRSPWSKNDVFTLVHSYKHDTLDLVSLNRYKIRGRSSFIIGVSQ